MKRNLFAILVVVAVLVALVFVASPSAKAADDFITASQDGEAITISTNNTVLNLNGKKNVVVKIENNVELSVIDTSFMVDNDTIDLTGKNAGTLTVDAASTGTIAPVALYGDFRYLAVKDGGTYSFHPFNMAISKLGINTIGQAVCLRVTFIANDVVKAKLTDYGIAGAYGDATCYSASDNYPFSSKNGIQAYFDLKGSFDADKLDITCNYQAYMVIDGKEIRSNYIAEITPRTVLKAINAGGLNPTANQKAAIESMALSNMHLADLFTSVTGAPCGHSAKTDATCIAQGVCKNCDAVTAEALGRLTGHKDDDGNFICDNEGCASIVTTPNKHTHVLLNDGARSDAWEITGTMLRPTGGINQWNFGFDIYDENGNALVFSATSGGLIFERVQGQYTRYPYHFNGLSQYNLSDATDGFHQINNQNDTMYFRAVIENDVFFAWFGYTEDNMVLTWMIPLAEELTGRWGATQWTDFSDSEYQGDDKSIPFPGFASGSKYQVAMHINATSSASGSINDMVIKTGADAGKSGAKFTVNLIRNYASWDYLNGTLNTKAGVLNQVNLVGDSKTWETSGTIKRNGTEPLNFGFMLQSGNKSLRMSAVTEGVLFESEEHSGHGRFPYHAMSGVTQYNLNPSISKFLKATEKDTIHFKAVVANDMFYVWFWFDGEEPTLSWVIPLTETLTGTDAHTWTVDNSGEYSGAFTGFDAGSSYKMSFYVKGTSSTAAISNFTVKTDIEAPKFITNTITNATVDSTTGTINNIPSGGGAEVPLYGASSTWEITGAVDRLTDNDKLNFGFMLSSGGKSLRVSAVTNGPVFESHAGHGRYAYHALIGLGSTTQYNLNTNVNAFLDANTQNKMYFKALVKGDMFYVWFWYEGEQPTLSWVIPLTEALVGVPGGNVWTDNPFTGFDPGSEYSVTLFTNNTSASGRFSGLEVKSGSAVTTKAPDYAAAVKSGTVDAATGKISSAAPQITNIDFAGNSQTWEISGTMDRPDTSALSFMFNLRSGSKTLNLTAATNGIVFGEDGTASGYSREPYHCFGVTQYNLRPISEFLTAAKTKMYFKVMIVNDVFYAWYWYEGEEPVLAWQVPLSVPLEGPNGAAWTGGVPFAGFDPSSSYILNFRVRSGGAVDISDLVVKTGLAVDTSVIPTPA